MTRFDELQGLRGLLALWVFLSHLVLFGWKPVDELPAPFNVLFDGTHAVTGFIILSGFVITHLVHQRRETYARFIWRRACRLYPVFVVTIVAAFFCVLLGWMPVNFTGGHAWQHLMLHLTLLHGAVPNDWIPNAQGSLLPPAWSVSLEWQFYLVAPFLLMMVRRSPRAALGLSLLSFAIHRIAPPLLGPHYDYAGFLPLKLGYFWLGSASWFFVRAWRAHPSWAEAMAPYRLLAVFGVAAMAVSYTHFLGVFIWLGVVVLMLPESASTPSLFAGAARRVLTCRSALWLGDLSYALYLVHEIVICLVQVACGSSLGVAGPTRFFALSALSIPPALAVSVILHRCVELPGIRLGHFGNSSQEVSV